MKTNKIWLEIMPKVVLLMFIIINGIAIFLYPGSTYRNHNTEGYLFTQNFLSDLGRTYTFSNELNFISSQLFNLSLILAGTIYIFFYFYIQKLFININKQNIAIIGSFFGVLGGVALIGVAFTPANLYLENHILSANWLFRFMFISSLTYTYLILKHPKLKNIYASGYFLFSIIILLYILISEFGPSPKDSDFALLLQVVSQKLILFVFMTSIYIQSLGIKKLNK
tara:strand:+ start:1082 stop:1756 length:675 start_codon:yes stop_codon:yes gene_type:complete